MLPPKEDHHNQDEDDHQKGGVDGPVHRVETTSYSPSNLSVKNASIMSPAKVVSATSTSSPCGERRILMLPFAMPKMMFSPTRNSPVFSLSPDGVLPVSAAVSAAAVCDPEAALALLPCLPPADVPPALVVLCRHFFGSFHDEETGIPAYR
jgi:hypothetical protein